MAEDRSKRRRDDRDRLRVRPIPEHVDPELTPPPQEPPRPESLAGYDTLPPPVREQFTLMADEIATLANAVGKVWDARNVAPQLERLETKVDGYVHDVVEAQTKLREFVDPAIKSMMARVDLVASYHERNAGKTEQFWTGDWPRMVTALEKLDHRFDEFADRFSRLERSVESLNQTIGNVAGRVAIVEAVYSAQDARIMALERRFADQDAADKREQALVVESDKAVAKRNGLIKAAWGAVVGLAGLAAGYFAGGCT